MQPSFDHYCDVEAEPLHRYRRGGYHPIHLGDVFKNGRYKVLHKLGFGGYSTAWVARDQLLSRYVALKVIVSEVLPESRELQVLRTLTKDASSRPGYQHIVHLLDDFLHTGPNGEHLCLILELLGSSIPVALEEPCVDGRLPGAVAKRVCKEMLLALDLLHKQDIGHGDLHTGNIAFTMASLDSLSEEALLERLGDPRTGPVSRPSNTHPELGMPRYLVWPGSFRVDKLSLESPTNLIDFGESFMSSTQPRTLHTPLELRAPELLFDDEWDARVDLWSLGCMMFELFVGQPPFCGVMAKKEDIIQQMVDLIGELPVKWQSEWRAMPKNESMDEEKYNLEELLLELYFNNDKAVDLSRGDISNLGRIIGRLLRYNPSARSTVTEVLEDEWFRDV